MKKNIRIIIIFVLAGISVLSAILFFNGVRFGEPDKNVDVDLSVCSSSMVYSTIQQMNMSPAKYNGKTVKIHGKIKKSNGKYFFELSDLTGCCAIREYLTMCDIADYKKVEGTISTLIGTFDNGIIENCRVV